MEKYTTDLIQLVNALKTKLLYNALFWIFGFFIYSYFMYITNFKDSITTYIFWESLLFLILVIAGYYLIIPKADIITKTAIEIEFQDENIVITTSPFKILWINKPSSCITFKKGEFTNAKVTYPIRSISDLNKRTLKLTGNGKEVYILIDYYDKMLEDILNKN